MMGREDIRRQRSDGVAPRMGNIRRPRAMNHRGRLEPCDLLTNLGGVQQVDTVPGSELRDLLRRRRMMRPPDDFLAPAKRLDHVASREAGGARDKNRHDYRGVSY